MKNIFTFDNVVKFVIAISLAFIAFGANAAVNGKVGIASDNIYRGVSISDGLGYSFGLSTDLNGFKLGANAMSIGDVSDADLMVDSYLSYGWESEDWSAKIAYVDHSFLSTDGVDWSEIGGSFTLKEFFTVKYLAGRDEAEDYREISTPLFPLVDVSYGETSNVGKFWSVSKSFDGLGGVTKIGYVDFSSDIDASFDEDQIFVSYMRNLF